MEMAQGMTQPLPDGWEKRTTPGRQACYLIGHKSRKSTWIAPPGCDIGVISFVCCNSSSFLSFSWLILILSRTLRLFFFILAAHGFHQLLDDVPKRALQKTESNLPHFAQHSKGCFHWSHMGQVCPLSVLFMSAY